MRVKDRHKRAWQESAARAALVFGAVAIWLISFGAAGAGADYRVACDAGQSLQQAINDLPYDPDHNIGVLDVSGTCRGNFKIFNHRYFTLRGVRSASGALPVLDGEGRGRVIEINNCCGGSLTLDNLKIENGKGQESGGAGISIVNMTVTLNHMTIVHNRDADAGGGVLSNGDYVTINDSLIADNSARVGGGVFISDNDASISGTTIKDNLARSHGGAMFLYGSPARVRLVRSIVSGNISESSTPGIIAAFVTIDHSSILDNRSPANAKGAVEAETQIEVKDSSVTGNQGGANSIAGGLVAARGFVILEDSTVADNTGSVVGGVYGGSIVATATTFTGNHGTGTEGAGGAGAIYPSINSPNIKDSILAGNSGVNPDCFAYYPIVSLGYNIVGNAKGCNWSIPATGDRIGTPTAPIDNLHLTLSRPGLEPGKVDPGWPFVIVTPPSPAIDAIPASLCPFNHDQRGAPRPSGAGCDIGSFEWLQG